MPTRILTILGSTGSIGSNTLDVVRQNPDRFKVFALAAGRNIDLLAKQIQGIQALRSWSLGRRSADVDRLHARLSDSGIADRNIPELCSGPEALVRIATDPAVDTVMSSIAPGVAGLSATYEVVRARKRVGLTQIKRLLVSGGKLVMDAVRESGTELILQRQIRSIMALTNACGPVAARKLQN